MEQILCVALIAGLLFLYWVFGRTLFLIAGGHPGHGYELLSGVFVYHTVFQLLALPMILRKCPLSYLTLSWGAVLAAVLILWLFLERKKGTDRRNFRVPGTRWLLLLAAVFVAVETYMIATSSYLGWDTSAYVGTIGTSVSTDSMYIYTGENGWSTKSISLRYALSSFYMHASVWCQVLKVRPIYYAKITQGGTLAVLANLIIYELGKFLFSGKRYDGTLNAKQRADGALGIVIAAGILNFFYQSIYTTSDFFWHRALEAKGYCANLILPFLFLLGLLLWRDYEKKEIRIMLFTVMLGNVAVSMSAMLTAPVLFTIVLLPLLLQKRSRSLFGFWVLCLLPNAAYFVIYYLYTQGIFKVGI